MTAQRAAGPFGVTDLVEWSARGAALLTSAQHAIDALNVFPVPDGDTGTNLLLTWRAAADALDGRDGPDETDLAVAAAAWSKGALLGARGNSGVIVAQFLRGIAEVMQNGAGTTADADSGPLIAAALTRAAEQGYAGVARPVEGTILSVAAAAAAGARERAGAGEVAVVRGAASAAAAALALTPEQLPALASAGVVDAGGQGLVLLLEALRATVDPDAPAPEDVLSLFELEESSAPNSRLATAVENARRSGIGDGAFEVMYLIETDGASAASLRARLDELGESVVVVGGGSLWNVHVHTDDAGPAVEAGVAAGRVYRIRITRARLRS